MEYELFKEYLSMGADGSMMLIMIILWRITTRITIVETKLEMHMEK